jgi:subtilisin family serine protease
MASIKRILALSVALTGVGVATFSYSQNNNDIPDIRTKVITKVQDHLGEHAPDRLIIKYKEGASETAKNQVAQKLSGQRMLRLQLINADLVNLPGGKSLTQGIAEAKADPNVVYAEPDYVVHATLAVSNDPYASKEWGLNNTGQTGGKTDADINLPEAWQNYHPSGSITVAVIDTGIDSNHPDLTNQIWVNRGEDRNGDGKCNAADNDGKDNDGNGYIDDCQGWNFVANSNNPNDDNKHGTHVSGTINAQTNNGVGIAGIVGRSNVKIMPLKFLDRNGSGYTSDAVLALNYAIKQHALLANNSWGGGGYSQALYDAINQYQSVGGLFIVAAGNSSANNDATPTYPANYALANIISVAAMTDADALASYSNYGATTVHLGAPGSNILSTTPNRQYAYLSGTSMATPHVTGVAALLWTQRPTLTASQVKNILLTTVRKTASMNGKTVSGGMVNAQNALAAP